jgi:hypothetical protein
VRSLKIGDDTELSVHYGCHSSRLPVDDGLGVKDHQIAAWHWQPPLVAVFIWYQPLKTLSAVARAPTFFFPPPTGTILVDDGRLGAGAVDAVRGEGRNWKMHCGAGLCGGVVGRSYVSQGTRYDLFLDVWGAEYGVGR